MSDAMLGYGITYEIESETAETFTKLGEVIDINLPSDDAEEVDVTHYESPDRTRETIAGLISTGEGGFTINWVPGNPTDELLRELRLSGEVRRHRVTFPNDEVVTYPGFIRGYAPAAPIDDRLTAQFTVKKAGAETWTTAT